MTAGTEILVVEDDDFVRSYMAELLRSAGYGITLAATGQEAISRLEGGVTPQLLVTDICLAGGMGGIALAETSRTIRPDLKVLYVSGYTGDIDLQGLGDDTAFLAKPFRRKACLDLVQSLLSE
ncbi:response regulator [Salipiger marinus]|jgi:CheY-like chemotaxis protein|uniref:Response regulator receiver domain-containing protein n=1 Tax=Salipiger marinus TaxID=555512 RepID=A0A1G8QQL1_9RHOB|nr:MULTISPECIES: response regulator [Salipiger]MEB3419104.1 response regulator [Salipiger manganoxidans]SDJ07049.1 Response regulator receiver domain-containing protein [Salipiger marinus]HBM60362.1 response regulator [Citreicella sp.]HBT01949.1 response regulator [Citreicella sp.]|tara:strand:- start:1548 stop:1916 length:369 start_codon:yes stop_codon:yes gene_type:complete